jgi:Resolvase, N terminal domain
MNSEGRRAAIYVRVSTGSQTTENQLRELRGVADRHGWKIVTEFSDKAPPKLGPVRTGGAHGGGGVGDAGRPSLVRPTRRPVAGSKLRRISQPNS